MTASVDSWESSTPMSTAFDVETSRLHHSVRVELMRLLSEATPFAWVVVDGTRCTAGSETVELDIAVRPITPAGPLGRPLLCIDLHAADPPPKARSSGREGDRSRNAAQTTTGASTLLLANSTSGSEPMMSTGTPRP